MAEGFTTAEHGVLDGTAIRACASRHHLVHEEKLRKRLEELSAAVERDAAGQPIESRPYWMAATPAGRQGQLQRYRRAEVQLADRLARNQERPKDKRLPSKQVRVSLSDPEAPLGRDKEKVFCPLYTAQFVVAADSLLILSFDVFAQPTDAGTLPPMLDRTAEVTGRRLAQIDTDAGYCFGARLAGVPGSGVSGWWPRSRRTISRSGSVPEARTPRSGRTNFNGCPRSKRMLVRRATD